MPKKNIPKLAIRRLCIYKRMLSRLLEKEQETISSKELGKLTSIPDYQVRKDISFIGEIGVARKGYNIKKLNDHIINSLGLIEVWNTAIVGVGQLGTALLNYPRLKEMGYNILCAFDIDPKKIGKKTGGITIFPSDRITPTVRKNQIKIGIICVPPGAAQTVCDALAKGGIRGILNFAPIALNIPAHIVKREIDFTVELEFISAVLNLMKKKRS
ncbi:MAG: redox-sensing transcriptional repressor Rex [Candidatus Aureabacteria bacterium]|nr:redox-sensing transcriptional repressor Rex [Candidatus Auribacterota bacterium]